jgi:hypothetical protein
MGLSFLPNKSVPSSLHRHHLPLFDFGDGFFAEGECLLVRPFSAVPADTAQDSAVEVAQKHRQFEQLDDAQSEEVCTFAGCLFLHK